MMPGRDRISHLPAEILDNILGFLPIVEAARTAVLSTIWRDIWSSLTQLNFDNRFVSYIEKKYSDSYNSTSVCSYVISKVLAQHNGHIRKFVLGFQHVISSIKELKFLKFDLDQWLIFITRKGFEEIKIAFSADDDYGPIYSRLPIYRLPNCVISCLTLKTLDLREVSVGPIHAPCIFPNVTSLSFDALVFEPSSLPDCAADVPIEKVVIIRWVKFDSNKEFKITQKLLNFLRACKKAKIVNI